MTPETEVISCPACRHLVRIPADWLGQAVQCPECQARFTAPLRDGGRLTDPVLIDDAPQSDAKPLEARPDRSLWLPAFALILLGIVSLLANVYALVMISQNREEFVDAIAKMMNSQPEDVKNLDTIIAFLCWCVFCGAMMVAGGMAMALRRWHGLAMAGSTLAFVNIANGCCLPGAVIGGWALLVLRREKVRARFLKS